MKINDCQYKKCADHISGGACGFGSGQICKYQMTDDEVRCVELEGEIEAWSHQSKCQMRKIAQLEAENERLREALSQLATNRLSADNCATVELAGKRIANIAKQALGGAE